MTYGRRELEPSTVEHSCVVIRVFLIVILEISVVSPAWHRRAGVQFVGFGCRWIGQGAHRDPLMGNQLVEQISTYRE